MVLLARNFIVKESCTQVVYHFMYPHQASCLHYHHVKHTLLSRVVNESDQGIIDRAPEEGYLVDPSFDPSLESGYFASQGKPWFI